MSRTCKLRIAIIILVAMADVLAARQVRGQAVSATARSAGAPADTAKTKAPDKQEAKSAFKGSSTWTAGATSFASADKGAWGGSQGFSSTDKPAWTPSSGAFTQGAVQPGGVWRSRQSLPVPSGGASRMGRTEADAVSAETATTRVPISGIRTYQSGSRQIGIGARHSALSAHQFGMTPGKATGKPAIGISGQRHSFAPTSDEESGGNRDSQSGPASAEKHGTTGLGDRPKAQSHGLGQRRLGRGLGGTSSGLDPNPLEPRLHSGQSKPQ